MNRFLAALGLMVALLLLTAGAGFTTTPRAGFSVSQPATLAGERVGPSVFTAAGIGKDCELTTFSGTLAGDSPALELEPTFGECTGEALSGLNVKWVVSECTFLLNSPEPLASGTRWRSRVDLLCPGELPLLWSIYESEHEHITGQVMCSTEMPPQQGIGSAMLSAVDGNPGEILIHWNLHGIKYRSFGFELICGSASGTSQSDADYRGTTRLSAAAGGGRVGIVVTG